MCVCPRVCLVCVCIGSATGLVGSTDEEGDEEGNGGDAAWEELVEVLMVGLRSLDPPPPPSFSLFHSSLFPSSASLSLWTRMCHLQDVPRQ
jgi:hypothetical protein